MTELSHEAKIGPNAVIQLIQALTAAGLHDQAKTIFTTAGASDWLAQPPAEMVDERRVAAIHQTVRQLLPPEQAVAILTDAGLRTGIWSGKSKFSLLPARAASPARSAAK